MRGFLLAILLFLVGGASAVAAPTDVSVNDQLVLTAVDTLSSDGFTGLVYRPATDAPEFQKVWIHGGPAAPVSGCLFPASAIESGCAGALPNGTPPIGRTAFFGSLSGGVYSGGIANGGGQTYAALPQYDVACVDYSCEATQNAHVAALSYAGWGTTIPNCVKDTGGLGGAARIFCSPTNPTVQNTALDFSHFDFSAAGNGGTCISVRITANQKADVTGTDMILGNGPGCDVNNGSLMSFAVGATFNYHFKNVTFDGGAPTSTSVTFNAIADNTTGNTGILEYFHAKNFVGDAFGNTGNNTKILKFFLVENFALGQDIGFAHGAVYPTQTRGGTSAAYAQANLNYYYGTCLYRFQHPITGTSCFTFLGTGGGFTRFVNSGAHNVIGIVNQAGTCAITGSITGTTLTLTAAACGINGPVIGMTVSGGTTTAGTKVLSVASAGSGWNGVTGRYTVDKSQTSTGANLLTGTATASTAGIEVLRPAMMDGFTFENSWIDHTGTLGCNSNLGDASAVAYSISGATLTVTALQSGTGIYPGATFASSGNTVLGVVQPYGTGGTSGVGGTGTYTLSITGQTVAPSTNGRTVNTPINNLTWSNNTSLTTGLPVTISSDSTIAALQWSGGSGYQCN